MAARKISTAMYLTPEQHEALRTLSDHTKVPMAVYIRDAVDLVLQQHGAELAAARAAREAAAGAAPSTEVHQ